MILSFTVRRSAGGRPESAGPRVLPRTPRVSPSFYGPVSLGRQAFVSDDSPGEGAVPGELNIVRRYNLKRRLAPY